MPAQASEVNPLILLLVTIAGGFALCFAMQFIQSGSDIRKINTTAELKKRIRRTLRRDAVLAAVTLVLFVAAGLYTEELARVPFGYAFLILILSGSLAAELFLIWRQSRAIAGNHRAPDLPEVLIPPRTSKGTQRIGRAMVIFALLHLVSYAVWSVELAGLLPDDLELSFPKYEGAVAAVSLTISVILVTALFALGLMTMKSHVYTRTTALAYASGGIMWTLARWFVPGLQSGAAWAWLLLPLAWYMIVGSLYLPRDWERSWNEHIDRHRRSGRD